VRLEGLSKLRNPVTSSGIEPATFQIVAQCLNQLRYRAPLNAECQANDRLSNHGAYGADIIFAYFLSLSPLCRIYEYMLHEA
jgi:hypothetical protein